MKFIVGQPREQMVLVSSCLDELVGADNEVRVIGLFVGSPDPRSVYECVNWQESLGRFEDVIWLASMRCQKNVSTLILRRQSNR